MLPNANIQEELALALVRINSLFSISVLQLDKYWGSVHSGTSSLLSAPLQCYSVNSKASCYNVRGINQ